MSALLLTRLAEDNQRLAHRFAALGVRTCSLPLLEIEAQAETPEQRRMLLDLDRYQAVMVVSPVAARLGLQRLDQYWPQWPVGIDWFAVGASTARILEQVGLDVQWPQAGQDSEALLALPRWQALLQQPDLRVLIWRGQGGRQWLATQVQAAGGQVDYLELYRRVMPAQLRVQLPRMAAEVGGILLMSAQALEHWHEAAGEDWLRQSAWRCWVPSERVAESAKALGCKDIIVCRGADDDAVIEAVMAHPLR